MTWIIERNKPNKRHYGPDTIPDDCTALTGECTCRDCTAAANEPGVTVAAHRRRMDQRRRRAEVGAVLTHQARLTRASLQVSAYTEGSRTTWDGPRNASTLRGPDHRRINSLTQPERTPA